LPLAEAGCCHRSPGALKAAVRVAEREWF